MYEIIKDVIDSGDYELKDILYKINKMWIESAITEEQKTKLDNMARTNANAENSYASMQEQINNIYTIIDKIQADIKELKGEEGTEEPTEPVEEYPEYIQPTGAHDAYNTGDKITYNGKKYVCKMDGCVWNPDTYPQGWEEVVETDETIESEEE